MVLALAVGTEPGGGGGRRVVTVAGDRPPPSVSLDRFVGLIYAEVGGGGVEEEKIDLQVEQVGHLVKDRFLQSWGDIQKEVHGAVEGVVGDLRQSGDLRVSLHPL